MKIKQLVKNINFKTRFFRTLLFLSSDIFFVFLSMWLAFFIKFDADIPAKYFSDIWQMGGLSLIFLLPAFYLQGLYSFSWSYVSAREVISLFRGVTVAFFFIFLTIFISQKYPAFVGFPRSILFISYFLIFLFCGASRLSKRLYLTLVAKNNISKEKTLIIGAGDAGEQIVRSILSSKDNPYNLVGFLDDSDIKQKVFIHGFKVLGRIPDLKTIAKEYGVECLIIALSSASHETIKKAVDLGRKAGIKKIKITPSISEIISGQISQRDLREVDVVDLLGRDAVYLEPDKIEAFIKNKSVLVTGAAGSIGSELSRQVARLSPSNLILLDQDETGIFNISEELISKFPKLNMAPLVANIKDFKKIDEIFLEFKPQIVFHAAAYKHVPLMEQQPEEAIKNNIFGTKIVTEAAKKNNAEKFIFISTDKAINPKSILGATKRMGEMICQMLNQEESGTKYISVRFGNVLDSRGSVIPTFREQIKKGGPVTVTHPDMKRYFMLIPEACSLVLQASAMGKGGEVFVLDMGNPVKILDLAREMIKLSGLEPDKDVPVIFSGQRPGEKLFEEILTAEEGTVSTHSQKIFMAKLSAINRNKIENALDALEEKIGKNETAGAISILEGIVPFYKR